MKRKLLYLALAAVAAGCAESSLDENIVVPQSDEILVSVAMPSAVPATRIAITEDAESGDWVTSWSDGDCLSGWSNGTYGFSKFEMAGSTDGSSASFSGSIAGKGVRLVYPYEENNDVWGGCYVIDISNQDVAIGSFDHMKDYTYMVSESYIEDVATSGINCTMKHVGAAMELALRFENIPAEAEAKIARVVMHGDSICKNAQLALPENIDSSKFYWEQGYGAYKLNVAKNSIVNYDNTDATTYTIPFNILPLSIKPGSTLTFDVYVDYTVEGATTQMIKIIEAENKTDNTITFDRGTNSRINKVVDMSDAGEHDMMYLYDFDADHYPTDTDTWVIGDISATPTDFMRLNMAIATLADSGREISLQFPYLKIIPGGGFSNNNNIVTSIEFPAATSIGNCALNGCNALTSLTIPASVTEIGGGAFNNCDNLTNINFETQNYILEDGVIYNSSKDTIVSVLEAVIDSNFTSSATTLLPSAFTYCSTLISVTLPEVETVVLNSFLYCENLTTVNMPKATAIEKNAFFHCTQLKCVDIPKVVTVGMFAFYHCEALSSINLPAVTTINEAAFSPYGTNAESMTLATNEGTKLDYISTTAFIYWQPVEGQDFNYTTLTIGADNAEYIDGTTLAVGDFIGHFKRVIVVDSEGNVVSDSGDPDAIHYINETAFAYETSGYKCLTESYDPQENGYVSYIFKDLSYSDSQGSWCALSGGYIYNLTEFIGFNKIEITEDAAEYNYTLLAGESLSALAEVSYTKEEYIYTYLLPDGCKFFALENHSEGKAYLDKICLHYDSLGNTVEDTYHENDKYKPQELITGGDCESGIIPYGVNCHGVDVSIEAGTGVNDSYGLALIKNNVGYSDLDAYLYIDLGQEDEFLDEDIITLKMNIRGDGIKHLKSPCYGSFPESSYNGTSSTGDIEVSSEWQSIELILDRSDSGFVGSWQIWFNFGLEVGTLYVDNLSIVRTKRQ